MNSAAICKSVAEKYFGKWQDAEGKYIKFDNGDHVLKIAAVFDDVPANSDFPFRILASYEGWRNNEGKGWPLEDWGSNTSNHQVYALLPHGTNIASFNSYLAGFEKKYNTEKQANNTVAFCSAA